MTQHNQDITFDKIINNICEYINVSTDEISYKTNFSVTTKFTSPILYLWMIIFHQELKM